MSPTKDPVEMVRQRLAKVSPGEEFGLVKLFGETAWLTLGTSGERKAFGKRVKQAVLKGDLQELEHVRIENSGRYDVYRKR